MIHISWAARTLPLVIGIGLFLSACSSDSYDPSGYTPPDPVFGTSNDSSWSGWHSGWTNDHDYIGD